MIGGNDLPYYFIVDCPGVVSGSTELDRFAVSLEIWRPFEDLFASSRVCAFSESALPFVVENRAILDFGGITETIN